MKRAVKKLSKAPRSVLRLSHYWVIVAFAAIAVTPSVASAQSDTLVLDTSEFVVEVEKPQVEISFRPNVDYETSQPVESFLDEIEQSVQEAPF